MPGPNNSLNSNAYRYAFQGQENDGETGKEAFKLRLWDSRIGRWLTTDPAGQYSSPYLGMGNNPTNGIDSDGAFWEELFNWTRGRGFNSNDALEFQANGGTLGEWYGSKISGYRQGYYSGQSLDESYGTAFKSKNDLLNYDTFDFGGRVAFGQLNQISFDIDSGLGIGGGFAVNWSKVNFLGGDYGNYWYTYSGAELGVNVGAAAGASLDGTAEFFVAIFNENYDSPSPSTFAGPYTSGAVAGEIHAGLGVSLFGSYTISGPWEIYSIGAGGGFGGNLKVNGELRSGNSVLHTTIVPTNDRTVWDYLGNKLIHSTLIY